MAKLEVDYSVFAALRVLRIRHTRHPPASLTAASGGLQKILADAYTRRLLGALMSGTTPSCDVAEEGLFVMPTVKPPA